MINYLNLNSQTLLYDLQMILLIFKLPIKRNSFVTYDIKIKCLLHFIMYFTTRPNTGLIQSNIWKCICQVSEQI